MGFFTIWELREAGRQARQYVTKSAAQILLESTKTFSVSRIYDIFLSHTLKDSDDILGLKVIIEKLGYSIYVDWIEDPHLDRSSVSAETADRLRIRMKSCRSLFFATSENSPSSKWMPWELGYFDGLKGRVAILPVADRESYQFRGQEYLGLYPYIDRVKMTNTDQNALFINKDSKYVRFDDWLTGKEI